MYSSLSFLCVLCFSRTFGEDIKNQVGITTKESKKTDNKYSKQSKKKLKEASNIFKSKKNNKKNHEGVFLEVGLEIGHQKTSSGSKAFENSPDSVNTARYGGMVGLGYITGIYKNFYLGLNVGVEGTFGVNKMWRGGNLKENSTTFLSNTIKDLKKYNQDSAEFRKKRGTLVDLGRTISDMMIHYQSEVEVSAPFYENVRKLAHDFGEGYGKMSFEVIPGFNDKYNANFCKINVVGANNLSKFAKEHFPTVHKVFSSVAENGVSDSKKNSLLSDSSIEEGKDITRYGRLIFGRMFSGCPNKSGIAWNYNSDGFALRNASQLFPENTFPEDPACEGDSDVTSDQSQLSYALKAINDLYYNTDDSDEELLKYRKLKTDGEDAAETKGAQQSKNPYKFRSKTTFDLCPHITVQLGYFMKELGGILYTKLGAMQLNGRTTIATDVSNVYKERFRKWTPYAALGFNKSLSEIWGVSVEAGHAFKTSKKFDIKYGNDVIKEKISVNRTMFKVMFTCNLGSLMEMD